MHGSGCVDCCATVAVTSSFSERKKDILSILKHLRKASNKVGRDEEKSFCREKFMSLESLVAVCYSRDSCQPIHQQRKTARAAANLILVLKKTFSKEIVKSLLRHRIISLHGGIYCNCQHKQRFGSVAGRN